MKKEKDSERCPSCGQFKWGYHRSSDARRDAFMLYDFLSSIGEDKKARIAERLMTFISNIETEALLCKKKCKKK